MRSLAQFSTYQQVFKDSPALPAFFESNLVDPGRVVKGFLNDPQAHIRIFYYNYLRLCFELEGAKSEGYVQKFEELLNNSTFQFIFYQDDDPAIYNDVNAKGLISQFFQLLGTGTLSVLDAVNNNPIIDVILVHFFRTLLILTAQTETLDNYIPKEHLIHYLSNFFGVEVGFHGECCHYTDTDIFVYEENEAAVYMAYMEPYNPQPQYQDTLHSTEEIPAQHNQTSQHSVETKYQPPAQSKYQQIKYQPVPQSKYQAVPESKYQPPFQSKYQAQVQSKYEPQVQPEASRQAVRPPSQLYSAAKGSYIASDFMDYTQPTQKLQSKATTILKGSETNISAYNPLAQPSSTYNQPSSTYNQPTAAYTQPSSSYGQFASSQVESLGSSKPMAFIETASISSNSDNKNRADYFQPPATIQSDYLSKTNSTNRAQVTHLDFQELPASVSSPSAQPIPTKDYGVSQNYGAQNSQKGQNQYLSSKVESVIPAKPLSSNLPDSKKDYFYTPKLEGSYNQNAYGVFNTDTTDYKASASYAGNTKAAATTTAVAGKKKPFGLNVSEEFTNSLTMKSMAEPYKSNVQNMKSRSRNFRASLANYIK